MEWDCVNELPYVVGEMDRIRDGLIKLKESDQGYDIKHHKLYIGLLEKVELDVHRCLYILRNPKDSQRLYVPLTK